MKIGIVTVSDRASRGEYTDLSGPAIRTFLDRVLVGEWEAVPRVVPDGRESVRDVLIDLCDREAVGLVLITGGTGPAPRDQTPEGIADVADRELPGFGELMRRISFETVPTAILSRQGASLRGTTLIVSLPGKPAAIDVCLSAVMPAIPYCLELSGAGKLETHPEQIVGFRPRT
ncbi:molybdopterin adenylyltransferase [Devosia naphthalenivorans]|uniref:molybdopterin adenylyltransferase n=1 Tax=Devosia naphthalenivorans TaxID=2082392 RepID=UPI000D3B7B39|nr:molybdopterin adenylyltransferase [Devosia naphthalenivorans]